MAIIHLHLIIVDKLSMNLRGLLLILPWEMKEGHTYRKALVSLPSMRGGSTSIYDQRSFDLSVSSELRHDKPNVEFHHTPWDNFTFRPIRTGNSFSTSGEYSLTNVRSRADLVLGTSLARTHPSNSHSQHSISAELFGQNSDTPSMEWNQTIMSTAAHDSNIFNHETNLYVMGGGNPGASVQTGGYDINYAAHRNTGTPVPQYRQGTISQPVQGNRTSFTHQSIPAFRSSSSYLNVADLDESFPLVTESYSSTHARPSPNVGWHSSNQNRQTSERRRPLSFRGGAHNRLASQSALYGSRASPDQHRDMRLDIDEMSYEELLALGERIGSVSTGLSEDMIKMYMTESIHCSSDIKEEEESCAICLI